MLLSNRQLSGREGDTQNTALFRIPNVGRNVMGSLLFLQNRVDPDAQVSDLGSKASRAEGKASIPRWRFVSFKRHLDKLLPRATRSYFFKFINHSFMDAVLICSIRLNRRTAFYLKNKTTSNNTSDILLNLRGQNINFRAKSHMAFCSNCNKNK